MTSDGEVVLTLGKPAALILFEFLSRYSNTGKLEIVDQAEQRVLWDLCCDFERVLSEPFRADYSEILAAAREKVRDE